MEQFTWQAGPVALTFAIGPEAPARLIAIETDGRPASPAGHVPLQPLVEILAPRFGRRNNSYRFTETELGARLRYASHATQSAPGGEGRPGAEVLRIEQRAEGGVAATTTFEVVGGAPAVRARTTVALEPGSPSVTLWAVTSLATGAVVSEAVDDLDLWSAESSWSAENRWQSAPLRARGLATLRPGARGETSRNRIARTSTSTWSSGTHNPVGAATQRTTGRTLAWQIEHNGAWHWEAGEYPDWGRGAVAPQDRLRSPEPYGPPRGDHSGDGAYVALLGPEDLDHHWSFELAPETPFTTVPVTITVAGSLDDALGNLALHRRAARRRHERGDALPVIFNDYMNTLEGDPTEGKLLPLIDAAARVGAEYFCIDAGWYDDSAGWWASVGDWQPSSLRFEHGLASVLDHVRRRGMVPGLWLEPEVVGVASRAAAELPEEAFLRRHGERIREHERYFLDLRSTVARAYLDGAVDRLIAELGVGYFKFDYNVTPGAGTDLGARSVGHGLLEHNRALVDWLNALLDRHPQLIVENCGSGAMRSDFAMLGTLQLQSTSDQQDPLLYPAIAVGALGHILPEQAGNWAYPQPSMSDEEIVVAMCAGLAGRLYLSGVVSGMSDAQLELVAAAVAVHQQTKHVLARSIPRFPLGLPSWDDRSIAVAFDARDELIVVVWQLPGHEGEVLLPLAATDAQATLEQLFPPRGVGAPWDVAMTPEGLRIRSMDDAAQARVFRVRRA